MSKDTNLTIELLGLRFYGQYGLYPVEANWTTELILDVSIKTHLTVNQEITLKNTIDYADVYKIIEEHMKLRHELLESAANQLILKLKNFDARIQTCNVRMRKIPQLGGALDGVIVQLEY